MAYTTVDDPSKYFQSNAYTGNGGTRSIVNDGNSDMQPDWVWIKKRNDAQNHTMTDSSRAVANIIFPDVNDAESATQLLTSFNTDGYSLNNNALANGNSQTYATWQWKANGGTTLTNDASSTSIGSIDSVIQANTDAGFSIITYTGTGSAATVAHGLSAVPHVLIVKKRNAADNWYVYHHENTSDPETDYLVLDTTDATADDTVLVMQYHQQQLFQLIIQELMPMEKHLFAMHLQKNKVTHASDTILEMQENRADHLFIQDLNQLGLW